MNELLRDLKMNTALIIIGILMVIRGLILICAFPFLVVKHVIFSRKKA